MNSGTAIVLANLSQNYSTSSVPPKSQYLVFMTLVVLNFYFNLGLASVHSKAIRKIITFWTFHRQYDCGGGKEDTIHFFTECAPFATIRTNLMRSISNILTHNNLEHLLGPAALEGLQGAKSVK